MKRSSAIPAVLCVMLPAAAWAQAPLPAAPSPAARPATLCSDAIARIEPAARTSPGLLAAIGRVESGRADPVDGRVKAWPWTINAEGRGTLFDTKEQAIGAVNALRARGVASIDVGCMQVNLMHHPRAFATLDEAFDPERNVRYAAGFLNALYADTKDWAVAVGYYHSRTPERSAVYQGLVLGTGVAARGPARVANTPTTALASAWAATMGGAPGGFTSVRPAAAPARRSVMLASRR